MQTSMQTERKQESKQVSEQEWEQSRNQAKKKASEQASQKESNEESKQASKWGLNQDKCIETSNGLEWRAGHKWKKTKERVNQTFIIDVAKCYMTKG